MKYFLTFKNGIEWESPNIFSNDPGWVSDENESLGGIVQIKIPVTKDKAIILQGFEKYNFFVEALQNISGGGKASIESFYFCGGFKGRVLMYKVIPKTRQIVKLRAVDGKEYGGSPTSGWREGLFGEQPKEGICSV